jgi:hypothetical protein
MSSTAVTAVARSLGVVASVVSIVAWVTVLLGSHGSERPPAAIMATGSIALAATAAVMAAYGSGWLTFIGVVSFVPGFGFYWLLSGGPLRWAGAANLVWIAAGLLLAVTRSRAVRVA